MFDKLEFVEFAQGNIVTRKATNSSLSDIISLEDIDLLAISLMRTGAEKETSYRIVVKEKRSKRDGAYLENLGTYNPTRQPAAVALKLDRVRYWISNGAQPTETVRQLIKVSEKEQAATAATAAPE